MNIIGNYNIHGVGLVPLRWWQRLFISDTRRLALEEARQAAERHHAEVMACLKRKDEAEERRRRIRHYAEMTSAVTVIIFGILCIVYAVIRIKNELY